MALNVMNEKIFKLAMQKNASLIKKLNLVNKNMITAFSYIYTDQRCKV